jgi:MFS family permease
MSSWSNLRTGLRQLEIRLIGELPPEVRYNQYADLYGAFFFGVFITGLNLMPVVLRKLGTPEVWLAFYSAQPFIGFLFTPLSVMLMPRQRGLRRYAVVFWSIARGSFLLIAFINQWPWLIALTFFFWIAETFPMPAYTRLMQGIFPANARGRVMATSRVGMTIITLACMPLAGYVLDRYGQQAWYPVTAVGALISLALFTRLRYAEDSIPASAPASTASFAEIFRTDRRFQVYLIGLVLFGVGFLSGGALYTVVQVDALKLSYSDIAALTTVQTTFGLISYGILGRQIDRLGGLQTLRWVFISGAVVPLCYIFATNSWWLALAFAAVGIVNAGMDVGTLNTVMQLSKDERLGEYSGLQTLVLGVRGLVAPFLGVWLAQAGLPYAVIFAGAAIFMLLGAALLWRVKTEKKL